MNDNRRVEVYKDTGGHYRWRRVVISNGQIVADGAEGYTRKAEARTAAERENPDLPVVEIDERT